MKDVLVTGAFGVLGSRVLGILAKGAVHRLVGLDKAVQAHRPDDWGDAQPILEFADLARERERLPDIMRGIDTVVHCAAYHGFHVQCGGMDPAVLFLSNVESDYNVINAARAVGVKRFVFCSSASVYGVSALKGAKGAIVIDERTPTNPSDYYDLGKLISENLLHSAAQDWDVEIIVLRPTRFFFDDDVNYNVRKLYRGVDIDDVAQCVVHAAMHVFGDRKGFRLYNLAADSPLVSVDPVLLKSNAHEAIEAIYPGCAEAFERNGWSLPASIDRVYDINSLKCDLGFFPRKNFESFYLSIITKNGDLNHEIKAGASGR